MNAAFTIVQNDLVILELWLKYYSRYFDHLHVLQYNAKNTDIDKLKDKYNFTTEQCLGELTPETANPKVRETQVELLKNHKWVLYSNCDEVLATDKYKDLREFMNKCRKDYIPCEAYDILKEKDEPAIDYSIPIFKQRRYWVKNPSYNKIILSKVPLEWNVGQHQIEGITGEESKLFANTGLYLIHLKFLDPGNEARITGPWTSGDSAGFIWEDKILMPEWVKEVL